MKNVSEPVESKDIVKMMPASRPARANSESSCPGKCRLFRVYIGVTLTTSISIGLSLLGVTQNVRICNQCFLGSVGFGPSVG